MYFFRVYQFIENKLSYIIYPIHIWWVYLGKTKLSTQHWLGAIFWYPHQHKGTGIRKSSLEWFSSSLHSWSSKTLVLRVKKPNRGYKGTHLYKHKLHFRCTRQFVPGNQEGHQNPTQFYHVVWIIFTRLHRLYNLQAAQKWAETEGKKKMMIHSQSQTTKGTSQKQPNCATTCAPHPPPHLCTTVLSMYIYIYIAKSNDFQRGRKQCGGRKRKF
jgi:hypothetical protein